MLISAEICTQKWYAYFQIQKFPLVLLTKYPVIWTLQHATGIYIYHLYLYIYIAFLLQIHLTSTDNSKTATFNIVLTGTNNCGKSVALINFTTRVKFPVFFQKILLQQFKTLNSYAWKTVFFRSYYLITKKKLYQSMRKLTWVFYSLFSLGYFRGGYFRDLKSFDTALLQRKFRILWNIFAPIFFFFFQMFWEWERMEKKGREILEFAISLGFSKSIPKW